MPADRILKLQAGLNGTPIPVGEPQSSGDGLTETMKQAILDAFASVGWLTLDPAEGLAALATALGTVYSPRYKGYITFDQIASRVGFNVLYISSYGTIGYNDGSSEIKNKGVAILKFTDNVRNLKALKGRYPLNLVVKAEQDGSFYGFQFGHNMFYKFTLAETQDCYVATSATAASAGLTIANYVQPSTDEEFRIELSDGVLTLKAANTETPMTIEGANMIGFAVQTNYFGYNCMNNAEAY